MIRNDRTWSILIIAGALAGVALSMLLIQEYYGISSGAIKSICTSAKTGFNSCRTVAESPYSAFHGAPFFGAIPVAVFGFLFYGFIAVLGIMTLAGSDEKNVRGRFSITLSLALAGLVADTILLYLSLFVIRALCLLCSLTYIATLIILLSSLLPLLLRKKDSGFISDTLSSFTGSLRSSFFVYTITGIAVLTLGLSLSHGMKSFFNRYESPVYADGRIRALIRHYRSTAPFSVDTSGSPLTGSPDAPVRMVLFIDFTCEHCESVGKTLLDVIEPHKGKIVLYYKHFPLDAPCVTEPGGPVNPSRGSCVAAAGALCAHRQGSYRAMYDALYGISMKGLPFTIDSVRETSVNLRLNPKSFDACLRSPKTAERLSRDIAEGVRLDVTGTPKLFINGRDIPNRFISPADLEGLVKYLLD